MYMGDGDEEKKKAENASAAQATEESKPGGKGGEELPADQRPVAKESFLTKMANTFAVVQVALTAQWNEMKIFVKSMGSMFSFGKKSAKVSPSPDASASKEKGADANIETQQVAQSNEQSAEQDKKASAEVPTGMESQETGARVSTEGQRRSPAMRVSEGATSSYTEKRASEKSKESSGGIGRGSSG